MASNAYGSVRGKQNLPEYKTGLNVITAYMVANIRPQMFMVGKT